jgi:hypothetical protein
MYNSDIYNIISNYSTELNSKNFICAGSREDCWAKINLGAKQIAFGKTIDSATHITLLPNLKKIEKCKDLDFLPPTLTHLSIPLPLIPLLNSKKIPNLQHLTVIYLNEYKNLNLNIADITLDDEFDLKSFKFSSNYEKDQNKWLDTLIDLNNYKNLEFLGLSLNEDKNALEYISNLRQVKYFSIHSNTKNLLRFIPKEAELIDLICNEDEKDLESILEFNKLKFLRIHGGLISEFDCKLLQKLPLEEISLISVYKLINPLALLTIPSLKKLQIMDYKKSLKKKDKELFQAHGFIDLNIE